MDAPATPAAATPLIEASTAANAIKRWDLAITACPVGAVTVFVDRAEVTRVISLPVADVGLHEVEVVGLTELAVSDSLRLEDLSACCVSARSAPQ